MWEEVRESCRPAHPPISKKSPHGQHLPLPLEQSYLYPAQAPRPICSSTAGTDRHMAAEAPEDTRSRILARGLGHLPAHLPLQPGPTVGHMPGACPLGGHGWAQASHPQACRVDPTLALVCVALFEDCPPQPARWVASAWTQKRLQMGLGHAPELGTFCLNCFSSVSSLLERNSLQGRDNPLRDKCALSGSGHRAAPRENATWASPTEHSSSSWA